MGDEILIEINSVEKMEIWTSGIHCGMRDRFNEFQVTVFWISTTEKYNYYGRRQLLCHYYFKHILLDLYYYFLCYIFQWHIKLMFCSNVNLMLYYVINTQGVSFIGRIRRLFQFLSSPTIISQIALPKGFHQ